MLPSIFETCQPRAEILSGDLSLELFAAKLRLVVEGSAPLVYQSSDLFFLNTYPTEGIKNLISEVFGRLTGRNAGSSVIRLETSFGGGKTHDEIALWHICKKGRTIAGIERFADVNLLPTAPIQVAAVDGKDLDPENGVYHSDTSVTTKTLWGEIAYQIGGVAGYQLLQTSDQSGVSPGTSVMERLIGGKPTVIILDEIARYLSAAKAKPIQESTLAKQVVAFLFSLMDLAASCQSLVFVYSLASASDTFAEQTSELQEVISASSRQERILKPSTDIEIYNIVKQRLFDGVDSAAAETVASQYFASIRSSHANLPDASKDSQYALAVTQSYPFHPELFNLLTKKIASIPDFQKTRGALRLFARVIRHLWRNQAQDWIPLIHTHHIPVGADEEITSDLTTRLGRGLMRNLIGADIYNPTGTGAFAQTQDQQWLLAGKPPFSSWVARTIFLHSLNQGTAAGISRAELNLSLLTPGLEISFIDQVLERLSAVAWYLDDDPVTSRSRFKEEPSINKMIMEEKERVGLTEAKDDLQKRRDSIFAKKMFTLIPGPDSAGDVDDRPDDIALCVIDFRDASVKDTTDPPPALVEQIFTNTGEAGRFRIFRNRLLFLVANRGGMERAIDLAKEYKAIQNILHSQTRLEDLSESQRKQLKDRSGGKDLEVRVALTNAYRHLFYPERDEIKAPTGLKHYVLPAEDSSTVKGKNNQQDVIFKALKDACDKIRRNDPLKPYAPAYIIQKVWPMGLDELTTKGLREVFAKDLGLKFLIDAEISLLRDTIRQGLQDGDWDMKAGERLFIKTEAGLPALPEVIEFSDRQVLYRRGILQPPVPKEIELGAEVMPPDSAGSAPVRLGWRAKEAVSVKLYQDGVLVESSEGFRPRDEYEVQLSGASTFKVVADYGNGEILEKEISVPLKTGPVNPVIDVPIPKPTSLNFEGTVNGAFSELSDFCVDNKVKGIQSLEISVSSSADYRKIVTMLTQLSRPQWFQMQLDQRISLQSQGQFIRFEYQGDLRGQQTFANAIMNMLSNPTTQSEAYLKLSFEFSELVPLESSTIKHILQQLERNPVERLSLRAGVTY